MRIRKEVIRPDTYVYVNQATGMPERMTVTPEMVKHFHAEGTAMLAAGLSIPVPLEHQPHAKAMTAAELAASNLRNIAGDTKQYEIGQVDDVDANGKPIKKDALFAWIDIKDAGIANKIKDKTIQWVSPWINSFVDGAGKAWNNVVSHIALTATPRITKQTPFESLGAAMSTSGMNADAKIDEASKNGFLLCRAGRVCVKGNKLKPMFPAAFSLHTGIKLAREEFDEMIEDEDESEDFDTDTSEVPPLPTPDADGLDIPDAQADIAIHDLLADLLSIKGIKLPSGTTKETFLHGLYEALMNEVRALGGKEEDGTEELGTMTGDDADKKPASPVVQESPPMMMSLTEIKKIKDPKERRTQEMFFSLHQENERNKALAASATKHILDEATRERTKIVEEVARRLPPPKRDQFLNKLRGVQLSLVDGKVVDPMADMIQLHAELANALTGPSGLTEQPQPKGGGSYDAKVLEDFLKKTGGVPAHA